jgi:hypothetical protein
MKNQETASGRRPRLPEVAVTLQEDSSLTGKINLSVEEENALLRERNRQLETENSILRERENTLTRDGVETLNAVTEALRTIQPGKETARFLKDSEKRILAAAPEDKPLVINARIKAAAVMIRDSPPAVSVSMGGGQYHYNTRTRTENRGLALVDHLKHTGKSVLKMPEARAVLETHEGRKLDRKIVWRALRFAQGFLRASVDTVGGIGRLLLDGPLVVPAHQIHQAVLDEGEESRVGPSRPRRDRVPWDGGD